MIQRILDFFEKRAYGVCDWWGSKLGLSTSGIRLLFIYLSFFTFGSSLIVYIMMAFVLENKEFFKLSRRRKTVWEL